MKIHSNPNFKTRVPLCLLIFSLLISLSTQSYIQFCNEIVPESPITNTFTYPKTRVPNLRFTAFFSGGSPILSNANSSVKLSTLRIKKVENTQNPKTFHLLATMSFWSSDGNSKRRLLRDLESFKSVKKRESRKILNLAPSLSFSGSDGNFTRWVLNDLESFQFVKKRESRKMMNLAPSLSFSGSDGNYTRRELKLRIRGGPRGSTLKRRNSVVFSLNGFFLEDTKKLCMVGNGRSRNEDLNLGNVVLKLEYPKNESVLDNSVVKGTLVGTGQSKFESIEILGFSTMEDYRYKYVGEEVKNGVFSDFDGTDNMNFSDSGGLFSSVCRRVMFMGRFELDYSEECENVGCNPLGGSGKRLPIYLSLNEIKCDGDKARYIMDFSDLNFNGRRLPFDPSTSLVAEGMWNEKGHMDMVACRLLNFNESLKEVSIGDCSIRLSVRFPATLSLTNRSTVVGMIWSSKKVDDHDYFGKIAFGSPTNGHMRLRTNDLKYVYTVVENATSVCSKKVVDKHKGREYPNGFSSDMRFDMIVKDGKGKEALGYSSPFSVGDMFFKHRPMFAAVNEPTVPTVLGNRTTPTRTVNISYIISFNVPSGFTLGGNDSSSSNLIEISAEGIYNGSTGALCMLGCRHIRSHGKRVSKNGTLDCELVISIQYAPLNSMAGSEAKGTIVSTRQKSDLLYFDPLELSAVSIYERAVKESIWRMDIEITMVLISNTLMCIFVVLQLLYVKKYPDVLPFISLVMLTVLTLALLIPLVLNFEALFMPYGNRQNLSLGSGAWVELNEVLVRAITMIAFLLEFRLLQQAWSARQGNVDSNAFWASDKKVLYLSIPLYIGGALIAWLIHEWKYSAKSTSFGYKLMDRSFWLDFKSYAGLILDGFLLPQIVFNIFCNTREKALAPSFYIGTTMVRLLPHAYDLFRGHGSSWNSGSIFADPRMDYYSTMWDVVISVGGLVFIVLVFLQQRFGGRCFLPKRFKESVEYEKVPVVSTELAQR